LNNFKNIGTVALNSVEFVQVHCVGNSTFYKIELK